MKKIIQMIMAIAFFLSFASIVCSAPLPWGIAINSETKQCTGHWPGDEYVAYDLLPGWRGYFPNGNNVINTEYGSCTFIKEVGQSAKAAEEHCCNDLGLVYVSDDSKIYSVSYPMISFLVVGFLVLAIVVGLPIWLIIRRLRKKNIKK
jgi:hypothetical protein